MKLRIVHIGWLLVGLPLVVELIVYCSMLGLLQQSRLCAERAEHSRQLADVLMRTACHAAELLYCVSSTDLTISSRPNKEALLHSTKDIENDLRLLSQLSLNSWQAHLAADAQVSFNRFSQATSEFVALPTTATHESSMQAISKLRERAGDVTGSPQGLKLFSLISDEQSAQDVELRKLSQLQNGLLFLLIAGGALGALVTIVLAVLFVRSILRRIKSLTDNSRLILSGKPLNPGIPGTNELADLDRAFYSMSLELERAETRRRAVARLRDQLVCVLSNDLQKPLEKVSAFLQSVQRENLDERDRPLFDVGIQCRNQMRSLVFDLSDLDRARSGVLKLDGEQFSIAAAAVEAKQLVSTLHDAKNIDVQISGDSLVLADRRRIVQVVMNLLSNAIKCSPRGSTIQVEITDDADTAKVSVVDHGRGISADMLKNVFEPFQQTEAKDATELKGVGLGLAICRELIRLHGGVISVKSTQGAGSTFSFAIPKVLSDEPLRTNPK